MSLGLNGNGDDELWDCAAPDVHGLITTLMGISYDGPGGGRPPSSYSGVVSAFVALTQPASYPDSQQNRTQKGEDAAKNPENQAADERGLLR